MTAQIALTLLQHRDILRLNTPLIAKDVMQRYGVTYTTARNAVWLARINEKEDTTMLSDFFKPKMDEMAPPPPCEKFHCQFYEQCGTEHLACDAFQIYVTTGRSINPCLRHDPKIKAKKKTGKKASKTLMLDRLISGIEPVPTKKIYDRIFQECAS